MRIIKALLKTIAMFAIAFVLPMLPYVFGDIGTLLLLLIIFIIVFLGMLM